MLENFKNGIAGRLLAGHIRKKNYPEVNFSNFFSNSATILIILPDDESEFVRIREIIDELISQNKSVYVFLPEHKVSLLNHNTVKKITFTEEDTSRLGLPKKEFVSKYAEKQFDIVIDLNMYDNLFYSAISNYFESGIRVGFVKNNSDLYYNFQVPNGINSENSYRNLLNSFKMF